MNSNWEEKKMNYLTKLENCNNVIEKVFSMEKSISIIDKQAQEKLRVLTENNKAFINKLNKGTFEVAMIGLENVGKSSFGNALVKNNVLPSKASRCTYTSTQLEYGEEDAAEIEFYSTEEFNENFRELLKDFKVEDFRAEDFSTLSIHRVEMLYDQMSESEKVFKQKIFSDIKEIIEGKDIIRKFLDKGIETIYINRGEVEQDYKSFITDNYKSRAVKKVIIKSSELKDTKEIKIYDVPGFDSPAILHEKQTIEKIQNADAIILIIDVCKNPQLNINQIQVLLNAKDRDGIPIEEKLFVFGNKVDTCNNIMDALNNIEILKNDVIEVYRIAKSQRVLIGSAQVYLEENYIIPSDGTKEKLKLFNMKDSIEEIKNEIKEYCNTDRFYILQNRIDKNLDETREVFNKIIAENNVSGETFYREEQELSEELKNKIIQNIKVELLKAEDYLKEKIYNDNNFTKNFRASVESIFKPVTKEFVTSYIIERIRKTSTRELPIGRGNYSLREKLYSEVRENFPKVVTSLADEEVVIYYDYILNKFLEALEVSKSNKYYNNIKKSVESFIESITSQISYDRKNFSTLIDHFSIDLMDILINYPLGSPDRKNKFKVAEQDFYNLATYYDHSFNNKPSYMHPLIRVILAQESLNEAESSDEVLNNKLLNTIKKYPTVYNLYDEETWKKELRPFSTEIYNKKLNINTVISRVALNMDTLNGMDEARLKATALMSVKGSLKAAIDYSGNNFAGEEVAADNIVINNKDEYIEKLLSKVKFSETIEEVVNEINIDGQNLINILKNVTLNAAFLEKAFLSTINKQINLIIDKIDANQSLEFRNFLAENIDKIYYNKFEDIRNRRDTSETRQEIAKELSQVVSTI